MLSCAFIIGRSLELCGLYGIARNRNERSEAATRQNSLDFGSGGSDSALELLELTMI